MFFLDPTIGTFFYDYFRWLQQSLQTIIVNDPSPRSSLKARTASVRYPDPGVKRIVLALTLIPVSHTYGWVTCVRRVCGNTLVIIVVIVHSCCCFCSKLPNFCLVLCFQLPKVLLTQCTMLDGNLYIGNMNSM